MRYFHCQAFLGARHVSLYTDSMYQYAATANEKGKERRLAPIVLSARVVRTWAPLRNAALVLVASNGTSASVVTALLYEMESWAGWSQRLIE